MSVLEVQNVSIRYLKGDFKDIGLKDYVLKKIKGDHHVTEFWADRNISFTLDKGEMLGIIGTNGAGKSTLLKAVSGIMEPTEGKVKRRGNVAALLELASGFDGELTVRENAYLRGAMLGYTRKFMDETYDRIIEFAELEDFQDQPFRQLSSGMKSRLAFSIASLVQPDILILDEVLSVGDGAFRKKSEEKMRQIIAGGAATILVSHSIEQVQSLCTKVLWLHKGEQIALGDTSFICGLYERFLAKQLSLREVKAVIAHFKGWEGALPDYSAPKSDEEFAAVLEQVRKELPEAPTGAEKDSGRTRQVLQPGGPSLKERFRGNLSLWLPIALFFSFSVLFYGPLGAYLSNSQEFWFNLGDVLKVLGCVSTAFFVGVTLVGAVLPQGLSEFLVRLFFGGALALYLQGNFLNINYGVLDGTKVDWNAYPGYSLVNSLMWVALVLLPFILSWVPKLKDKGYDKKIPVYLSLFFLVIQLPALAVQLINYEPNAQQNLVITNEGQFEISEQENVLVFVFDAFDDAYYREFLAEHPDFTQQLPDFVDYDNTLAAGARTMMAIPAMLSGQPFRRESTHSEYIRKIWAERNILSAMAEVGTDVRVFSGTMHFSSEVTDYVQNICCEQQESSLKILGKKFYKLTGYIFSPHLLKQFFWMDTSEFDEAKATNNAYSGGNVRFVRDFRKAGFTPTGDYEKAFRFYHTDGTHSPYTLGEDGKKSSEATRKTAAVGLMRLVVEMMDDLKAKGIYDNTTIIITADHGERHEREQPLFLLKEAHHTGDYTISHVPLSLFDLPVYLADVFGVELDGQTYGMHLKDLTEDMVRERHFFRNMNDSTQIRVAEFQTTGLISDYDQLTLIYEHEDALNGQPYVLGTELSFAEDATGNRYTVEGITENTGWRTHLKGTHAAFEVPLAESPTSETVTVDITPFIDKNQKTLSRITVNGTVYFDGVIDRGYHMSTVSFKVPAEDIRKANNTVRIDFDFPEGQDGKNAIALYTMNIH